MPETKTYLELSQDAGTAHKFYEVVVVDNDVTIRFGRIGDRRCPERNSAAGGEYLSRPSSLSSSDLPDKCPNAFGQNCRRLTRLRIEVLSKKE